MQNDNKFKIRHGSKGYTLMEIVVAIGIFVIVMTAITGVFVAILRAQRKTQAMQATQQDARWAMETMARYARMGKIDYCEGSDDENCHITFPGAENQAGFDGVSTLYLEDHTFKLGEDKLKMDDSNITSEGIEVTDLRFYISPDENPYVSEGLDEQSRVTILMKTKSVGGKEEEEMTLQTTVSTRAYTR